MQEKKSVEKLWLKLNIFSILIWTVFTMTIIREII